MILAALGMADDDGHGPGILEHFGADIARIGAGNLRVAVLAADGHPPAGRRDGAGDQRGRRTDQEVGARRGRGRMGRQRLDLHQSGAKCRSFSSCQRSAPACDKLSPEV